MLIVLLSNFYRMRVWAFWQFLIWHQFGMHLWYASTNEIQQQQQKNLLTLFCGSIQRTRIKLKDQKWKERNEKKKWEKEERRELFKWRYDDLWIQMLLVISWLQDERDEQLLMILLRYIFMNKWKEKKLFIFYINMGALCERVRFFVVWFIY